MANKSIFPIIGNPSTQEGKLTLLLEEGYLQKIKGEVPYTDHRYSTDYSFYFEGYKYRPIKEIEEYIEELLREFINEKINMSVDIIDSVIANTFTLTCHTKEDKINALKDIRAKLWDDLNIKGKRYLATNIKKECIDCITYMLEREALPLINAVFFPLNEIINADVKAIFSTLLRNEELSDSFHILNLLKQIDYTNSLLDDELKVDSEIATVTTESNKKLVWKGTPAQFGFIIDRLVKGGYLEKPKGSFEKDADFYLEHFNINTTKGTLTKELSETTNSMETKNRNKFEIPGKDELW